MFAIGLFNLKLVTKTNAAQRFLLPAGTAESCRFRAVSPRTIAKPSCSRVNRSRTIALGVARLQNGLAPLQNAFTALQNGLAPLQNAFAALLNAVNNAKLRYEGYKKLSEM